MSAIEVRRIRDAEYIERVLRQDAFDEPIPFFPPRLLRHAVRDFLAPDERAYFVVAEVDGRYAGFVFAHALGVGLWRGFARNAIGRYPLAVATVVLRLMLRRARTRLQVRKRSQRPATEPRADRT